MKISDMVEMSAVLVNTDNFVLGKNVTDVVGHVSRYYNSKLPKEIILLFVYRVTQNAYETSFIALENPNTRCLIDISDNFDIKVCEDQSQAITYIKANMYKILDTRYKIGCDPEIFVTDKADLLIPAFTFLDAKPGPSYDRTFVSHTDMPVYWDGFQAEFETQPTTCLQEQCRNVSRGLRKLLTLAKSKNLDIKLSLKSVMDIAPQLLAQTKEEHAQFGCMPSINVYGFEQRIHNGYDVFFRPTGGHIHFGFGKKSNDAITRVVKSLDMILGVACTSLFAGYEDRRRRQLYGLPGEFRLPKHGLEYRTLSNAWLSHPVIMHLTFDLARKVVNAALNDWIKYLDWKCDEKETIRIIMESDVEASRKVLAENKAAMLMLLKAVYQDDRLASLAYDSFMKGMKDILAAPENIIDNWKLAERYFDGVNFQWKAQGADMVALNKKIA